MSLSRELSKFANRLVSILDTSSFANPGLKSTISANIICKNNIKTIHYCLESLVGVVDELIIIDTGSTDGTLEYIKNFTKDKSIKYKLVEERFFQGYSYHRNQAIQRSSGDWILVVDSDEFLSKLLQLQLRKLTHTKLYSAYKFFRRWINSVDGNSATYIFTQQIKGRYTSIIRLFRNLPDVEYRGEIHEAVFGLEHKRINVVPEISGSMYHLDVAVNSFETRSAKVSQREDLRKGSGHAEEYLPELFDLPVQSLPQEDLEILLEIKGKLSQNKI